MLQYFPAKSNPPGAFCGQALHFHEISTNNGWIFLKILQQKWQFL
jgi:hypothetical protein